MQKICFIQFIQTYFYYLFQYFQFLKQNLNINNQQYYLTTQFKKITKKYQMNPFQRLKKTIDNVGLTYLYPQGQQQVYSDYVQSKQAENLMFNNNGKTYKNNNQQQHYEENQERNQNVPYFSTTEKSQLNSKNNNEKLLQLKTGNRNLYNTYKQNHLDQNQQVERLTALFQIQQTNYMAEINSLSQQLERTTRNLKIQQKKNKQLVQEVCSFQKQIESLKECIHKQEKCLLNNNKSDNSFDDRERKYKEEIYRINMTVSQLATEINYQKSSKKALTKELQICRQKIKQQLQQNSILQSNYNNQLQTLKCQLQKRTEMFEHSIKAHSEQKKESKQKLQNLKQKLQTELQNSKKEEQKAKEESFKAVKQLEVLCFKKEQVEKQLTQLKSQNNQLKQKAIQKDQIYTLLRQQFQELNTKYNELKLKYTYSIQELQQERNNVRVKVVQVTDESLMLQLQMYKRQCKQLLQQKAILSNLKRQVRSSQANYKVVQTQIRNLKNDKDMENIIKK